MLKKLGIIICSAILISSVGIGCSIDTVVKDPVGKVYRINESYCINCLACISPCPQNAISFKIMNENDTVVIIDQDKCIGCGECTFYCKYGALDKIDFDQ